MSVVRTLEDWLQFRIDHRLDETFSEVSSGLSYKLHRSKTDVLWNRAGTRGKLNGLHFIFLGSNYGMPKKEFHTLTFKDFDELRQHALNDLRARQCRSISIGKEDIPLMLPRVDLTGMEF